MWFDIFNVNINQRSLILKLLGLFLELLKYLVLIDEGRHRFPTLTKFLLPLHLDLPQILSDRSLQP